MGIGCVICTEEFLDCSDKVPVAIKTCGHVFHDLCLSSWLSKNNSCPVCRSTIINTPVYITRLHFQRLSLDNSAVFNNLLDESAELKQQLQDKDELLKIREQKIIELSAAISTIYRDCSRAFKLTTDRFDGKSSTTEPQPSSALTLKEQMMLKSRTRALPARSAYQAGRPSDTSLIATTSSSAVSSRVSGLASPVARISSRGRAAPSTTAVSSARRS